MMSLLRDVSRSSVSDDEASAQKQSHYTVILFHKIVDGILLCPLSKRHREPTDGHAEVTSRFTPTNVVEDFVDTWLNVYADVRWYFLRRAS